MKRSGLMIWLCMCLGVLVGCSRKQVEPIIELSPSAMYTEDELHAAIEALMDEFSDEWEDCTLEQIVYNGDEASLRKAEYYGYEKGVEFLIDFEVGSFASPSLNPNSKYEDYQFFLVEEAGEWVVDYAACGYG